VALGSSIQSNKKPIPTTISRNSCSNRTKNIPPTRSTFIYLYHDHSLKKTIICFVSETLMQHLLMETKGMQINASPNIPNTAILQNHVIHTIDFVALCSYFFDSIYDLLVFLFISVKSIITVVVCSSTSGCSMQLGAHAVTLCCSHSRSHSCSYRGVTHCCSYFRSHSCSHVVTMVATTVVIVQHEED
jgi:hypothetical protein